jgi:hypothetical protein
MALSIGASIRRAAAKLPWIGSLVPSQSKSSQGYLFNAHFCAMCVLDEILCRFYLERLIK